MANASSYPMPDDPDLDVEHVMVDKGEETGFTFTVRYTKRQVLEWCFWLVDNFDE